MSRFKFNPFTGNFDITETGVAGSSIWTKVTGTVSGSSSSVIDTVDLTSFTSIKYIISARNKPNSAAKYLELSVNYNQSSLSDSVSGKINNGLSMNVDANLVGGNLELDITNNETFDIDLDIAKLVLT